MPLEVTYENESSDIIEVLQGMSWTERLQDYFRALTLLTILWPIALLLVIVQEWYFLMLLGVFVLMVGVLLTGIYMWMVARLKYKVAVPPGKQTLRLFNEYIEFQGDRGCCRLPWSYIKRVRISKNSVAIYIESLRAYIIPRRYFDSPEAAEAFAKKAEELYLKAQQQTMPLPTWEDFHRDFKLAEYNLIQDEVQWEKNLSLESRLIINGPDPDGTNPMPTPGGLAVQFIFPVILIAALIALKTFDWDSPRLIGTPSEPTFFYYFLLVLATFFMLILGQQISNFVRYWRERARQAKKPSLTRMWIYREGIATWTEEGVGLDQWGLFGQISDDREAMVFYDANRQMSQIIPKAVINKTSRPDELVEQIHRLVEEANTNQEEIVLAEVSDNPYQSPSAQ
ncbi:YcxB family protein [Bremerella cremea]|uniref:YcxB family protein n=1 Tax=Bremerella cremea TaxID=1031537 RepID=UPI0031EC0798